MLGLDTRSVVNDIRARDPGNGEDLRMVDRKLTGIYDAEVLDEAHPRCLSIST